MIKIIVFLNKGTNRNNMFTGYTIGLGVYIICPNSLSRELSFWLRYRPHISSRVLLLILINILKWCVRVLFLGTPGGTAAALAWMYRSATAEVKICFELNYKLHFRVVSRQTLPFAFRTLGIYNYYMTCLHPLLKGIFLYFSFLWKLGQFFFLFNF